MRIGLDIDGVLANFFSAYENTIVEMAGEDKFPAHYPKIEPPVWNWPEYYGYPKYIIDRVWQDIKASSSFWETLGVLPGAHVIAELMPWAVHDVYFITSRPGVNAKGQTERWLKGMLGISNPTVLLSTDKGPVARGLELDCYLDDKAGNIFDTEQWANNCRSYLLTYPYNQRALVPLRVKSVQEFCVKEGLA